MDAVAEAHVAFAETVSTFSEQTSELLNMVIASLEAHGALLDSLQRRVKELEARECPECGARGGHTHPAKPLRM